MMLSRVLSVALISLFLSTGFSLAQPPGFEATDLRCEYLENPLGMDIVSPRFSWKIDTPLEDFHQTAYQIQVAEARRFDQASLVWDSGRVSTADSIHQAYAGPAPISSQRYFWKVRVWNEAGTLSDWSEIAWWETGLLQEGDWKADWIAAPLENPDGPQPSPHFRKEFQIKKEVRAARLYVTSLGLYEASLNGRRVGNQLFTPGWTSYDSRLQYQTYDVTDWIQEGPNAVGAVLGDGWYRGYLGFQGQRSVYGKNLALLLQLDLRYSDGSREQIGSDLSWKVSSGGPIRMSDIYMGEVYDTRLERHGWDRPGFDDTAWETPLELDHPKSILLAPVSPPVRKIEEIRPVEILVSPRGERIIDMGQNLVGWVKLSAEGPTGHEITLRHAEVLDRDGNLYTANLRTAEQKVRYILDGKPRVLEPHFTFQGFRYVAVEGYPGELSLDDFTGVVIHSDMERTGDFKTSDPSINQLQHNILWGQKGNFLDVPTDCPQRDERLGWTGDAQVFIRTASFNMNVAAFFTKWLADLRADQMEDGRIPHVVPDVLGGAGSAGWADAGVIVPWALYVRYGDQRILEAQYRSMKAWVDYIRREARGYLWDTGFHFGDWLSATYDDPSFPAAATDKDLIATAFFAHSTDLLSRIAKILGKSRDAEIYSALFEKIRSSFQKEFLTPNNRLSPNTQTAYVLALRFGLLPEAAEGRAIRRLVEEIEEKGDHLSTGFLGTPHLAPVLTEYGERDVAYRLLHQDTYPSWLYPIRQGATTIWERWDGLRPDGTFQTPEMNSFNHYAYGAIGEWLYGVVAGIQPDPDHPGFKRFRIAPQPGGQLTSAEATLDSPYGTIVSSWVLEEGHLKVVVEVPPNTTAEIYPPQSISDSSRADVAEDLRSYFGEEKIEERNGLLVIRTGSGRYQISYPFSGE